jgi:hypothetical protein
MAAVVQIPSEQHVHPLLRHPRPITRDSAKAQRMLGLISDTEEKLTGLRREKSKTTKWLERPMYADLDVSDVESEKDDIHEEKKSEFDTENLGHEKYLELMLNGCAKPDRPTLLSSEDAAQNSDEPEPVSEVETSSKRRPEPLKNLRPISYNSQHLLSPDWTVSPATMSPDAPRQRPLSLQRSSPSLQSSSLSSVSSSESVQRIKFPQTWPPPMLQHQPNGRVERPVSYQPPSSLSTSLGSPQLERRPRPTSSATYQHRDRRNSKIASSRGLRNNSYPNFSRPISEIAPKVVPGEDIESDPICNRSKDIDLTLPSIPSPICGALDGFEINIEKSNDEKTSRNRWSSIPSTFKKFTMRRTSGTAQDQMPDSNMDEPHPMKLTEQSPRYPGEVSQAPVTPRISQPGGALLPTPSYSPLEFQHPYFEAVLPPPFAPWAAAPPSPPLSQDKRRGSELSLSPPATRKRTQSRLSVENAVLSRPVSMHSRNSSLGLPSPGNQLSLPQMAMNSPIVSRPGSSRRGTPSLERSCIVCKTAKEPTAFLNRRIAANCWHEPATCYQCLQAHIERCVTTQGWEHCTCPECNERLTYEDMGAFADDDTFVRWDE